MNSIRWPVVALAALAVILVGLGLWQTGGPAQGAMERRDDARLNDLYRLQSHVTCLTGGDAGIAAGPDCPDDIRVADPYTGAPYVLTRLDNSRYRVCAAMEVARNASDWRGLSLHDGLSCLEGTLPSEPS